MKKYFFILLCLVLLLIGTVQAADAIDNAAASVNIDSVLVWMQTNWESVALIVSEVAALISVICIVALRSLGKSARCALAGSAWQLSYAHTAGTDHSSFLQGQEQQDLYYECRLFSLP